MPHVIEFKNCGLLRATSAEIFGSEAAIGRGLAIWQVPSTVSP